MITQELKQLIDVGEIGNASTGDILFEGGKKINEDFNSIYNTFGDQRLFATDSGVGLQKLHATGYYQKMTKITDWSVDIPMGSMLDIDARLGFITARLAQGKAGECVVLVDSQGTLSPTSYIEIQPKDRFANLATPNLKVTTPYSKITLWCISDAGGVSVWDYSIENMFSKNGSAALNSTYSISSVPREIPIAYQTDFVSAKLLVTGISADSRRVKTAEVLLFVDTVKREVTSVEYGVILKGQTNEDDPIFEANYILNAAGYICMVASAPQNLRLAIKVGESQTLGVPL